MLRVCVDGWRDILLMLLRLMKVTNERTAAAVRVSHYFIAL